MLRCSLLKGAQLSRFEVAPNKLRYVDTGPKKRDAARHPFFRFCDAGLAISPVRFGELFVCWSGEEIVVFKSLSGNAKALNALWYAAIDGDDVNGSANFLHCATV